MQKKTGFGWNSMMSKIYSSLAEAVRDLYGNERVVTDRRSVSGGDINEACALTLDDGTRLFMKYNSPDALSNLEAEAVGLQEIAATGKIGVARPLGLGRDRTGAFLLLDFISGGPRIKGYWETFAGELAAMHQAPVSHPESGYGFYMDNFIGMRRQINTPHDKWIPFFRDCRLKPQFEAAAHYFGPEEQRRIEYLLSHLDAYLVEPDKPALLHGDLWAGNHITGDDGKGWLIDPAVYYGHPEADLAMTELFGGFPGAFYDAYKVYGNLSPDYEERRDIYNLYHLLNHLNMFGGGYYPSVRSIVYRLTGTITGR